MVDLTGTFVLGTTAITTVYAGCALAPRDKNVQGDEIVEISWRHAVLFPVTASAMLMMIFYMFWLVQYFLIGIILVSASISAYDVQLTIIERAYGWVPGRISKLAAGVVVANILILWAFGNWVANNLLGVVLAIQSISAMRFPNLKTAALSLMLLFLYDAFWVFGSEHIPLFEGRNVMVEVATKTATNPVHEAGGALGWEWLKLLGNPRLQLPIKLIFPSSENSYQILGLGDIALPGILVNLAHQFDSSCADRQMKEEKAPSAGATPQVAPLAMEEGGLSGGLSNPAPLLARGGSTSHDLFTHAIYGYSIGLFMAFSSSYVFNVAQPALIYLVPGTLLPLILKAHSVGVLSELWQGMKENSE